MSSVDVGGVIGGTSLNACVVWMVVVGVDGGGPVEMIPI